MSVSGMINGAFSQSAAAAWGWSHGYFITYDGRWMKCPPYTVPTENGHNCIMPYCKPNEVFLPDGRCEACPKWTRPVHHGFYCRAEVCGIDDVLQEDGSCKTVRCPAGYYKEAMGGDHCHMCKEFFRPNAL